MEQILLDIYPAQCLFLPSTGRTLVKKFCNVHNDTIVQREHQYTARTQLPDELSEVELS